MNTGMTILMWGVYFISLYFAVFWLLVFLSRGKEEAKEPLKEYPFVSIAIPAYNEEGCIGPTIERALQLEYPKEKLEILIVNDGSKDKTRDIVNEIIEKYDQYNLKLISQENKGKGAALNNAIDQAKGEFFVCLDADSFINNDALQKMLPHFGDEQVAAVLPSLKVHKPKKLLQKLQWYEYIINMFYKEMMGKLNCVHVTPGPFSVYRLATIRKIGKFDEDNITEDLEIALRLQYHNYKIIQVMDTEVTTLAPETLGVLYKQRNRWFKGATLNAIQYRKMIFNKKYGDFGFIQMPTIISSGVIAVTLVISIVFYGLKPYIDYLYNLRLVHFDIVTFIKHMNFNFSIMDLNFATVCIAGAMLTISLYVIKKSEVSTNERFMQYGSLGIIFYLLFYFLFLGFVWVGVLFDIVTGRKQQW
jgi:cellulose synthase/poly-beta-1,6-N-acetylglucosamine synthase-like glycosyltransferase